MHPLFQRSLSSSLYFAAGRILTSLTLLVFAVPLSGQSEGIAEKHSDVVDVASSIGQVVFVYHQSTIADSRMPVRQIEDLEHPAIASNKAHPSPAISDFISSLFGSQRTAFRLYSATATNYGDDGYFWKFRWLVHPVHGDSSGGSGKAFEYYSVVRGDGTVVRPTVFLRDIFGAMYDEFEEQLFSVMAMDDLQVEPAEPPTETELRSAASRTLEEAIATNELDLEFRFESVEKREFSGKLNSDKDIEGQLVVWAVRFVDASVPNGVEPNYTKTLTIWVTGDLTTSTVSVGGWDPISNKRKAELSER